MADSHDGTCHPTQGTPPPPLDLYDGWALAAISRLGDDPSDEYEAYRLLSELIDAIYTDPVKHDATARILLDAWRAHDGS